MPFVKIHVLEGRYDEARLDSVSNAIQQALRAELGMASDELFHIIHLLQPAQFPLDFGQIAIDSQFFERPDAIQCGARGAGLTTDFVDDAGFPLA